MKLEIYDEAKNPEPVLRLKLHKYNDYEIELIAVDGFGDCIQTLLSMDSFGSIKRAHLNCDFIEGHRLVVDKSNCLLVS